MLTVAPLAVARLADRDPRSEKHLPAGQAPKNGLEVDEATFLAARAAPLSLAIPEAMLLDHESLFRTHVLLRERDGELYTGRWLFASILPSFPLAPAPAVPPGHVAIRTEWPPMMGGAA